MEVTINYNGQAVTVEVTLEVYEYLDRADHKAENLSHEQRRHWDGREFDEYIVATEGVGIYLKEIDPGPVSYTHLKSIVIEVYYAEDDEIIAKSVKEYLEQQNCKVTVFGAIVDIKRCV